MGKLKLTRNQLAAFLPDNESVKQFETLFNIVDDINSSGYNDAVLSAGTADAKAQQAVDSIQRVADENLFSALSPPNIVDETKYQDAILAAGIADAKAQQALDSLSVVSNENSLATLSPEIQNDNSVTTDYIDFAEIAPHTNTPRRMTWNEADGTLDLHLKGGNVTLQVGQEEVVRVVNKSGANLIDGQVVYISGAQGQRPKVELAVANGSSVLARTVIGLVTEPILNNEEGFVTISGLVRGLDTSAFVDGDVLYLSTTPGAITNVPPAAPVHRVVIGFCINANPAVGSIFVTIQPGYDLEDLSDVDITTPADNDLVRYDLATLTWKNMLTGTGVVTALGVNVGSAGSFTVNGGVGSFTSLAYTTTLTGGTGIVNLGSGQFYKDASGNVGVGTASPFSGGLMTVRSGAARYSLGDTSQAVDKKYWDMVSTGGTFYMRSLDDTSSNSTAFLTAERGGTGTNWIVSAVTLNTAGGERMRIDSSGNVMIGTTISPTVSRLYINSGESRIQSRNSTSGANGYSGSLATNEYRGAWAITNTIVTFGSNDVERFRLDTGGNLLVTSIGGLGYGTGSGGAVTQLTSRTTGVTLDKTNGAITMFSAAGSATAATFTVTNSKVAATDVVNVSVKSATNLYSVFVTATAAGSFNITFQTTGGTAVDAPVINFAVIKAVIA